LIHTETLATGSIWLFRHIPEGDYGEPYDWVVTGVKRDIDTIELKGAMGHFSPKVWQGMYDALHTLGFKRFVQQRCGQTKVTAVRPKHGSRQ
jgi:hypothetical protein